MRRPAGDNTRWWATKVAWAALAAIAVGSLAYGSLNGGPSGRSARLAQLDSVIKCPACEDLSIGQSDAPSSVTLKNEVASFVKRGWSNGRIETWVTGRYGSDALLVPSSGGDTAVLYLVPVAAVGIAVGGLGWYLWKRRPERHDTDDARREPAP